MAASTAELVAFVAPGLGSLSRKEVAALLDGVAASRDCKVVLAPVDEHGHVGGKLGLQLREAGLKDKGGRAFTKGAGCIDCHNSGFRGRIGIYEVMEVTDEIRRLIHREAASHEISEALRRNGVMTLREEGVKIALEHHSSLEEVLRVTHSDEVETNAEFAVRGSENKSGSDIPNSELRIPNSEREVA